MRTSRFILLLCLTLISLLVSTSAFAKVKIVASTPDLAAIAQAVGGSEVEVTALASATQDPHYVDARPNLLVPLSRAQMLVVNGLELEVGWLPALLANARNRAIQRNAPGYVDASTFIHVQGVPAPGTDRSSGDVHPGGNPHFTYDPRQGIRVANGIRDALIRIEPAKADLWRSNAATFTGELDRFAQAQRRRFSALPAAKRNIVSYHSSLIYLLDWLTLREAATVEPLPGIDPTPRHTASVLQTMKAQNIRVVLQEEFYPRATSNTLASMTDGEVVILPGATRFDRGQTYLAHMQELADAIFAALQR